jgi:hypothetical protein
VHTSPVWSSAPSLLKDTETVAGLLRPSAQSMTVVLPGRLVTPTGSDQCGSAYLAHFLTDRYLLRQIAAPHPLVHRGRVS